MNTNDEFLLAISQIQPIAAEAIEYRIHYDADGRITMCSMQQHPVSEQYLVVSKQEYDNYFKYIVVNNKLKLIDNNPGYHVQLKKSDIGFKVVKDHAGLIVEPNEAYSNTEYYDRTN